MRRISDCLMTGQIRTGREAALTEQSLVFGESKILNNETAHKTNISG